MRRVISICTWVSGLITTVAHENAEATRLLREGRIRAMLCEFNEHWLSRAGSSPQVLERTIRAVGLSWSPLAAEARTDFFSFHEFNAP